jgi:hypothetical protein
VAIYASFVKFGQRLNHNIASAYNSGLRFELTVKLAVNNPN